MQPSNRPPAMQQQQQQQQPPPSWRPNTPGTGVPNGSMPVGAPARPPMAMPPGSFPGGPARPPAPIPGTGSMPPPGSMIPAMNQPMNQPINPQPAMGPPGMNQSINPAMNQSMNPAMGPPGMNPAMRPAMPQGFRPGPPPQGMPMQNIPQSVQSPLPAPPSAAAPPFSGPPQAMTSGSARPPFPMARPPQQPSPMQPVQPPFNAPPPSGPLSSPTGNNGAAITPNNRTRRAFAEQEGMVTGAAGFNAPNNGGAPFNPQPSFNAPNNAPPAFNPPGPPSFSAPPSGMNQPPMNMNQPPMMNPPMNMNQPPLMNPPMNVNQPPIVNQPSFSAPPPPPFVPVDPGQVQQQPPMIPLSQEGTPYGSQQQLQTATSTASFDSTTLVQQFNQSLHLGPVLQIPNVALTAQLSILDLKSPAPLRQVPQATPQPLQYNCNPLYKRASLNAVPQTQALLTKSRLPFGLVLSPFRLPQPEEEPIPVIQCQTITRCRRCRAYLNPFVQFVDNGVRWKCNLCYLTNDLPANFDYDSDSQQYVDRNQRVELTHCVMEYIAPSEYMVRPPQPLIYLFLLDVSYAAIHSGMVATVARSLLSLLDVIPNESGRLKVGFMTVDRSLHFYHFGSGEAQMRVVPDVEDPFLPCPDDLLVSLQEYRSAIESFLERLGRLHSQAPTTGSFALGPALQAASKLLTPTGGKMTLFLSSMPTTGEGALKSREDTKAMGTAKESSLLQPSANFYKTFATECSRLQMGVDIFAFSGQHVDLATLSSVSHYTGGNVYHYPGFNATRQEDAEQLSHDLSAYLSRPIALEAVLRIRASKGIRMQSYFGHFFVRSTDLLSLPNVSPDNGYGVLMTLDEPLQAGVACFQTALLHTTCHGERRIRVLTMALPVTSSIQELYTSMDQCAMAHLLGHMAVERVLTTKFEDARDALVAKCIDLLGVYRQQSSHVTNAPQLMISDNWKLLPLLILSLLKCTALRGGASVPLDHRAVALFQMRVLSTPRLIQYLHPDLYSLHNMHESCGVSDPSTGQLIFPPPMNLSSERLEKHGLYLLDNGFEFLLWLGKQAAPQLCLDVFGVPTYAVLASGKITLPASDNPFAQRVHALLNRLREQRTYYPPLILVKEDGDAILRSHFLAQLIEDRGEAMSLGQWLMHLREKVMAGNFG